MVNTYTKNANLKSNYQCFFKIINYVVFNCKQYFSFRNSYLCFKQYLKYSIFLSKFLNNINIIIFFILHKSKKIFFIKFITVKFKKSRLFPIYFQLEHYFIVLNLTLMLLHLINHILIENLQFLQTFHL